MGTWRLVTRCETFSEATLTAACFTGIDSFRGSERDTLEVHEVSAIGYRWQREQQPIIQGQVPERLPRNGRRLQSVCRRLQVRR